MRLMDFWAAGYPVRIEGFIAALALCAAATLFLLRDNARVVRAFLAEPSTPLNLAVVRITLFAYVLASDLIGDAMRMSAFTEDFSSPPSLSGWLWAIASPTPPVVQVASRVMQAAMVCALVGYRSQAAAAVAAVFGAYVLGVPQLFGKVYHYHHLVWFMAMLAVAPCGAALSVDALTAAYRVRLPDVRSPHERASAYGTPLRFMYLLTGVMYLFPGLYKLAARAGEWWFTGATLRAHMHKAWMKNGGWVPPVRIDQFDIMMTAAATSVFLFEVTFVVVLFFPRARRFAVAAGLLFHNLAGIYMGIWFVWLQVMYVMFVDWSALFETLGTKAARWRARCEVDDAVPGQRLIGHAVRALDLLRLVDVVPATVDRAPWGLVTVTANGRTHGGAAALLALTARVPLMLAVVPAAFVLHVSGFRRIPRDTSDAQATTTTTRAAVIVVGSVLLVANVAAGALGRKNAWPFAGYPAFAFSAPGGRITRVAVVVVYEDMSRREVSGVALGHDFKSGRALYMLRAAAADADRARRTRRVRAILRFRHEESGLLDGAVRVELYGDELLVDDEPEQIPLQRRLLNTVDLAAADTTSR